MFDLHNEIRNLTNPGWERYRQQMLEVYTNLSDEENFQHAAKQAYIALSSALIAAAFEEVDCTPMEGFVFEKLDELLDLRKQGLRSVLMLPIGYRDEEKDWAYPLKKVRISKEELVQKLA